MSINTPSTHSACSMYLPSASIREWPQARSSCRISTMCSPWNQRLGNGNGGEKRMVFSRVMKHTHTHTHTCVYIHIYNHIHIYITHTIKTIICIYNYIHMHIHVHGTSHLWRFQTAVFEAQIEGLSNSGMVHISHLPDMKPFITYPLVNVYITIENHQL